jgi:hypothetical protein
MPTIGGDNGVSMGGYDYGVAPLKYYYISAGSKGLTKLVFDLPGGTDLDIQPPGTNLYLEYKFVPATPVTAVCYPNQLT